MHAGSFVSRLALLPFFLLLHVASFLSLLGIDCLSRSLSWGPGPPSPPTPELTPFLSGPRQRPTPLLGTVPSWICRLHQPEYIFIFLVGVQNGTVQNSNVTKQYMLQNGPCYKKVRVTQWRMLKTSTITKRYVLQNGTSQNGTSQNIPCY
jgi:hypothetical protein